MKFVWDETKNDSNRHKHCVSFETAQLVFDDPFHVSKQDRVENSEQRWQTIGLVHGFVLLLVAHLHRSGWARNYSHHFGSKGRQGGTEGL